MTHRFIACLAGFFCLFLSSCAVTIAPTESSTETLDKTSQATLDLTSSTSPGSNETAAIAEAFTQTHYTAIQQEMAVGEGEHLRALAELLHVPETKTLDFCAMAKQQYPVFIDRAGDDPSTLVAVLRTELHNHPKRYL